MIQRVSTVISQARPLLIYRCISWWMDESIDQSINDKSIHWSANLTVNRSINHLLNQTIDQSINWLVDGPICPSTNQLNQISSTCISDSSSTSEPWVLVSLYSRLSSSSCIFLLFDVTSSISLVFSASSSDFSVRITLPSSWSSSPFIVTVKSIIAVRADTSGVYDGFGSFVVMYR